MLNLIEPETLNFEHNLILEGKKVRKRKEFNFYYMVLFNEIYLLYMVLFNESLMKFCLIDE